MTQVTIYWDESDPIEEGEADRRIAQIADLQARKRGLSDRIMDAADRPLKWTREELLHLLKPLPQPSPTHHVLRVTRYAQRPTPPPPHPRSPPLPS